MLGDKELCVTVFLTLLGLSMIGVGFALVAIDDSIKDFLGTFNDEAYDKAIICLFVAGCFFTIIGIISCLNQENCQKWLVRLFVLVYLGPAIFAIIIGYNFVNGVDSNVTKRMDDQVKNYYRSETSDDEYSVAWNGMQTEFDCCGSTTYRAYRNSSYHKSSGHLVPYTCCKNGNGTGVAVCRQEAMTNLDPKCDGRNPTAGNWLELNPCGCRAHVLYVLEQAGIAFSVLFVLAFLPMGFMIYHCIKTMRDDSKEIDVV